MHILAATWDLLFPLSTDGHLVAKATPGTLISLYQPTPTPTGLALAPYQHPVIKACIRAGKFEHNPRGLRLLGHLLTYHLTRATLYTPANTILCPLPLHARRQRERGYNQVAEICRVAQQAGYQSLPLLRRPHPTSPQSHLTRADRLTHLTGAFTYQAQPLPSTVTHLILIDDVLTTGATMQAARTTLAAHLPSHLTLHCLALAH